MQVHTPKKCDLVVMGGSTYDITGISQVKIISKDSNPGRVIFGQGGVARNIVMNIARLGLKTAFITALGDDVFSREIMDSCCELGIETDFSYRKENATACIYHSILASDGELELAVADLRLIEEFPLERIKNASKYINESKMIVMDTNLPEHIVAYIAHHFDQPILVDPVSMAKAVKLCGLLDRINTIKANRGELEVISGMSVGSEEEMIAAGKSLMAQGLKRLFVTMGREGVFYMDDTSYGFVPAIGVVVKNATGAGDSFTAGVAYGLLKEMPMEEIAHFSTAMSNITLQSEFAVNPDLTIEKVQTIKNKSF